MGYNDVFNNKNKKTQAGETWKFPNVGDSCAGALIARENYDGDYKGAPTKQVKYTLVQEGGSLLFVYGRFAKPGEYKAFPELDKAPLGSICGVTYLGEKTSKLGTAYKAFDIFVGDIDEKVLAEYVSEKPVSVNVLDAPF